MTEQIFTTEQSAEVLGLSRHRLYSAVSARIVKPDVLTGRVKGFRGFSLAKVLDLLKPHITAQEYERARNNLRINGLPTTPKEAAEAAEDIADRLRKLWLYFT